MDFEQISYEVKGEVGVLTLNRPERLNAWTVQMWAELTDAIEAANTDPAVGALVLTGAGRGFCAGADVKDAFASQLGEGGQRVGNSAVFGDGSRQGWIDTLRKAKPVVAAVNGVAVGIGVTMILPCDFIMASDQARFSLAFVRMGIVPELASSHFLVQRMGWGWASDLMLSGRMIDAAEARDLGLADDVIPADSLLAAALVRARSYAANPDLHLRMIKQLVTANACETDLLAVQQRELDLLDKAFDSPEHAEAVAAFLEKRPPKFR